MATKLKRHRNEMLLMVVALGLVFVVTAGLIVSRAMHAERVAISSGSLPNISLPADETSAPVARSQEPLPAPATAAQTSPGQPQQPPQAMEINPASRPPRGSIDPKAVQDALATLAQNSGRGDSFRQQPPASSTVSSGSDRYPGSQPLEVKDVNLPDIGVPVTSEAYTTSDSLSTVLTYYTRRYPDAEVLQIDGQKVIAIDRPGATKVIAVGTTGEETRIAILKPAN